MILLDMVNRIKARAHRGNTAITTDTITQQIIDALNDARREVIRLLPKQWLRAEFVFNTVVATAAAGATSGTSISASSPGTSTSGTSGNLTVAINGETGQSLSLATSLTSGATIALAIQNAVRAFTATYSYNQVGYTQFTCVYSGGLYTLTSGSLGTLSSVVVTATGNIGSTLKLGIANGGTEAAGTGANPQDPRSLPKYDLPTDCQEPVLFRYNFNGADYFLSKVDSEREFYLNIFGTTVAPNKPLYFFDAGVNTSTGARQVYIWPIADKSYTIFLTYMVDPSLTDLSISDLNSAVPYTPSYVQDVVWKGGLYHFLKNFDDVNGQATAKQDYEEAKQAMEIADERDLDSDIQFRMDIGRRLTDFRAPGTGIRLK